MTKAKTKSADDAHDPVVEPEEIEEIAEVVADAPPAARKSLGVKEPIVFKWKIVGYAGGFALTLFKSIEREDAEAQLERLRRDGYYADLQIMEADAKVLQPAQPKESKAKSSRDASAKSSVRADAASKSAKSPARKSAPSSRRPAAKKSSAKSKSAPTKSASSRKPAKKK